MKETEKSGAPHKRRSALVVNTRSKSGEEAFSEAERTLEELGVNVEAKYPLEDPARMGETVQNLLKDGLPGGSLEMIILGGGDGTVSSVVDFLADKDVVLGLLPLGTANDFARTLEIPDTVPEACETIARGKLVDVDLGLAGENYYVNVASVGLSVGVTQALTSEMKRRVGALAYPLAAMRAFFRHKPFGAKLTFPDDDHEPVEFSRLLQVAVGNGKFYGGGLAVAPEAGMDDGTLDVYAIKLGRSRNLLGVARYARSGDFIENDCVSLYKTKKVILETDPPQKLNVDGEVVSRTPKTFSVASNALKVMVPESSDAAALDSVREVH